MYKKNKTKTDLIALIILYNLFATVQQLYERAFRGMS